MSEYSRRQFLHDSLIAAAAAATAGSAGKLFAADNTATSVTEKGPNEKLRFLICGVNGQGNEHIKNLLKHDEQRRRRHRCHLRRRRKNWQPPLR